MSKRIAIIEAAGDSANHLGEMCSALGFEVQRVIEAEAVLGGEKPSIAFLADPGESETVYEACVLLRGKAPSIPVVMVLDPEEAESERLVQHQHTEGRANAYIIRPVTGPALVNALRDMISFPDPDAVSALLSGTMDAPSDPNDMGNAADFFDEQDLSAIEAEADSALDALFDPSLGDDGEIVIRDQPQPSEIIITTADVMSVEVDVAQGAIGLGTIALDDADIEGSMDLDDVAVLARSSAVVAPPSLSVHLDAATIELEDSLDGQETVALDDEDIDAVAVPSHIAVQKELKIAREELVRRRQQDEERREADAALRQENAVLRDALNTTKRESAANEAELEKVSRSQTDTEILLAQVRGESETQAQELADLRAIQNQIKDGKSLSDAEMAGLKERLEETRGRLTKAQEETEKVHLEAKTNQARSNQREAELTAELSDLKSTTGSRITELSASASAAQTRIEALEAELAEAATSRESTDTAQVAKIAELTGELDSVRNQAKTAVDDLHREGQEALAAREGAASEARQTFEEQIRDLKAELEQSNAGRLRTEGEHADRVAELHSSHQAAVESLRSAHKSSMDAMQSDLEARLQAQATKHADSLSELEAGRSTMADEVRGAHQDALKQLQVEHERALERRQAESMAEGLDLKRKHSTAMESLEADLRSSEAAALEALAREHSEAVTKLRGEQQTTLEAATTAHDTEMAGIKAAHQAAIESLRTEHKTALGSMSADHARTTESVQQALDAAVGSLTKEHERALAERADLHKEALANQRTLYEERMENQRSLQERESEVLKGEHAQKVGALTRENAAAFEALESQNKREYDALVQENLGRVETLQADLKELSETAESKRLADLSERDEAHLEALESLRAEAAKRLETVSAEKDSLLENERGSHAEGLTLARAEVIKLEEELGGRVKSLEISLQEAHATTEEAGARRAEVENELAAVQAELQLRLRELDEERAKLRSLESELTGTRAELETSGRDTDRLRMAVENEQQARKDVEVDFAAKAADLEQKFVTDSARLATLEGALTALNGELALREKAVNEQRQLAADATADRDAMAAELAGFKAQAAHREDSLKKLRMAIAVANTFAGEVGSDDEEETADADGEDGQE